MDGELSEFSLAPVSIECFSAAFVAAPASPIARLMLVNATNNADMGELVNGAVVDQTTPDKKIAVRADVASGQTVGSVQWALDGKIFRTETSQPFAVANDSGGKLFAWTVVPGEHTLTVIPFSKANATGAKLTEISVTFTVAGPGSEIPDPPPPPPPPPVPPTGNGLSGMTVINAVTNQPIGALTDGAVLDLSSSSTKISVRADVIGGATVGSVQWMLNGTIFRTENSQPFAVANDTNGKFLPWSIAPGQHTLTVIPWTGGGASGTKLAQVSATFTVLGPGQGPTDPTDPPPPVPGAPALTGMTLMKGDSSTAIGAFTNGAVLDLNTGKFSVRADVAGGSTVGSVTWSLNGSTFRTENSQPFAVANDSGGKFLAWNVPAGNHTLTVTPYSGAGATGAAGTPISVSFSVKAASNPIPPTPTDPKEPTASVARQFERHQENLNRIKQGPIDLLFLGDSITDWFDSTGKSVYDANYKQHKVANFGISGDKTQNVIWRITEGKELEGINPKALVLMIGTNNLGEQPSDTKIADGIKKIVAIIRQKLPNTKILLLGVFPRGGASDARRGRIANINSKIDDLHDGNHVTYLDIGKKFLDSNNNIPSSVMPDGLHPSAKGYQIWADAMRPTLNSLLS